MNCVHTSHTVYPNIPNLNYTSTSSSALSDPLSLSYQLLAARCSLPIGSHWPLRPFLGRQWR